MGKKSTGTRFPNFCLNRIRPLVKLRSPPMQSNLPIVINSSTSDHKECDNAGEEKPNDGGKLLNGRKIMIVVDSSSEAKGAIQWSLTHTAQCQDKVVLLCVIKPSNNKRATCEASKKQKASRAYELVHSLKIMCQQKRPEVQFEVAVVEGMEKGPAIVEEARKQGVALLVMGQKKQSTTWRLLMMWAAGNRVATGGGVVEHCIQNADCVAVAVRRKSKKVGGYLITTKRHKDFWLLA